MMPRSLVPAAKSNFHYPLRSGYSAKRPRTAARIILADASLISVRLSTQTFVSTPVLISENCALSRKFTCEARRGSSVESRAIPASRRALSFTEKRASVRYAPDTRSFRSAIRFAKPSFIAGRHEINNYLFITSKCYAHRGNPRSFSRRSV